jgi:DinB superfamily
MNALSSDIETRRAQLRADLEGSQREFHALIGSLSEQGWTAPSHNPGWTNGQLLFHIMLGFILVRPLAGLLIVFGHLPRVCSKVFAGILNFSTPLFNRLNAIGPRVGARLLGSGGVLRTFDQVHGTILTSLDRLRPSHWALTMHYPTRWDPRFRPEMRLEDLVRYPIAHLKHHRQQLNVS